MSDKGCALSLFFWWYFHEVRRVEVDQKVTLLALHLGHSPAKNFVLSSDSRRTLVQLGRKPLPDQLLEYLFLALRDVWAEAYDDLSVRLRCDIQTEGLVRKPLGVERENRTFLDLAVARGCHGFRLPDYRICLLSLRAAY